MRSSWPDGDGRLNQRLKPSTLDCTPSPNPTPLASPPTLAITAGAAEPLRRVQ